MDDRNWIKVLKSKLSLLEEVTERENRGNRWNKEHRKSSVEELSYEGYLEDGLIACM